MSADAVVTQVVEAVVVRPGDTLVVAFSTVLTHREFDEIAATLKERLGPEVKTLALAGALGLYVLRPDEVAP